MQYPLVVRLWRSPPQSSSLNLNSKRGGFDRKQCSHFAGPLPSSGCIICIFLSAPTEPLFHFSRLVNIALNMCIIARLVRVCGTELRASVRKTMGIDNACIINDRCFFKLSQGVTLLVKITDILLNLDKTYIYCLPFRLGPFGTDPNRTLSYNRSALDGPPPDLP